MSKLLIGVVGAGVMGRFHAQKITLLSGVKLAGIFDQSPSAAEKLSQELSVVAFSTLGDLLTASDAIIVAVPTQAHFETAQAALNAGKHLLLEKPFTGQTSRAAELISLATQKGVVLTGGMIEFYNPAYQRLLRLLRGEKIHGLDIKRFSPLPERITDTNVIFDMMIHDFHLLLSLISQPVESIKALGTKTKTKKLDQVTAVLTHSNGIISRLEANRNFMTKVRAFSVSTEKELIEADLLNKRIYIRDFSSPTPSTVPVKPNDQLEAELTNFIETIKGRDHLLVTPDSIIKALKLAEEVQKIC